jgi:predicted enzyme related to lactoylglutathione lyase
MRDFIRSPGAFETAPNNKWYFPWRRGEFSIPNNMYVHVRNIDAVTPWYIEKIGLRKLVADPLGDTRVANFKFHEVGSSVVLTTRPTLEPSGTPMLFTKKIAKRREALAARGVAVGQIEQDRQGTHYFQIRDPEENVIEVVESH